MTGNFKEKPTLAVYSSPGFFYGYIIVLALFSSLLVMYGLYYSFGLFFKPVLTEFGWTRAVLSGAFSVSSLLSGVLAIVIGRLNDSLGPRLVMAGCGLFLGLGYLLMSQVGSIWQFYLFYGVIIGVGMSGSYVPLLSTVARWFVKRRGLMSGIVVSGIGVGTMVIPPLANWLISSYGWRIGYIVVGLMALLFIIGLSQFLRRDPAQIGQIVNGAEQVVEERVDLQLRGVSFSEAVPSRGFWMLCLMEGCFGFLVLAIMVHIAPYAIDLGIPAVIAARILATIGGLSIAGRVVMGSLSDRIGCKSTIIISFIIVSVALLWLQLAKEVWMFYLFSAIFGFSYGALAAMESPIVAELFGLKAHGTIMGGTYCSGTALGAIGPVLVGHIFDITGSYKVGLLICVMVSAVGLISALFLKPAGKWK